MGDELRRIQRAYAVLARCNQLIVRDLGAPELLEQFCRVAVESAGYRLAWVGMVQHDEARTIKPVAHCGFEDGYLDSVHVSWGDGPHGLGPTGRAVRERRPVVASSLSNEPDYEPWREEALRRGYASSVALPLNDGPRLFGTLNLYAVEPEAFDERELGLLVELAEDLSFGLRSAERKTALENAMLSAARVDRLSATVRAAAGAIHDLNNLLGVVQTSTCLIRAKTGRNSSIESELADIEEAVSRSSALARQTLHFAVQRSSGEEEFEVNEAIQRVWPLLRRSLAPHHTSQLELGGECRVKLEPLSFEQVLLNLVSNARDAMPRGGSLTVRSGCVQVDAARPLTIGALSPGRWAMVSVEDTGVGMSPEVQQRIFEPFFTTRGQSGTGVGLATVFAIVNGARGAIEVSSQLDRGSRFAVYLPCRDLRATASGSGP